jgi:hypothetical protein
MSDRRDRLSLEELGELEGEPLPYRTAMSAVIPPPPLAADPRVVGGGVDMTVDALGAKTTGEHVPKTDL